MSRRDLPTSILLCRPLPTSVHGPTDPVRAGGGVRGADRALRIPVGLQGPVCEMSVAGGIRRANQRLLVLLRRAWGGLRWSSCVVSGFWFRQVLKLWLRMEFYHGPGAAFMLFRRGGFIVAVLLCW